MLRVVLCIACNATIGMHFILMHIRSIICFLKIQENVPAHAKSCQVQHDEGIWILAVSVVEAATTEKKGPGYRAHAGWPEKSGMQLDCRNEEHRDAIHMEEPQLYSDKPQKQKR